MVSYQIFTQTAVTTVVDSLAVYVPVLGLWLASRIDMVIFVYAFAWVFVLSSIIPSLLLGKERSVFVQFIVCLILTLMGFVVIDVLAGYGFNLNDPTAVMANPYTQLFSNIVFAALYLSLPYIFMLAIDVRGRKKRKLQNDRVKKLTEEYFKETPSGTTTQA